jgi:hypothetical protein
VSWVAIIILLFPPVVPSTPRKTLVTALVAASMDPTGALIWKALGADVIPMSQVFILAIPNYLCALIAPLISHIITRLGREVRKSREMGSYVWEISSEPAAWARSGKPLTVSWRAPRRSS